MISDHLRLDAGTSACDAISRGSNRTVQGGNQNIDNYSSILWCDNTIDHDNSQKQHTLSHLTTVSAQVKTFTDRNKCFEYIDALDPTRKFFLIVSGSLGMNLVPNICENPKVKSIYIFCRATNKYEVWAKQFSKINGVFDQITQLIPALKEDKERLESEILRMLLLGQVENLAPMSSNSDQSSKIKNPANTEEKRARHKEKESRVSFPVSSNQELYSDSNIACSNTVKPCTLEKELIRLPDIWPCVCVIGDNPDELIHDLQSVVGTIHYFNSIEQFSDHLKNHPIDPHMIVVSNPISIGYINRLAASQQIRKLYIRCSNNRLAEYDRWRGRYPGLICVLQHLHTLCRMILWDLSACLVDIGNYYTKQKRVDMAVSRYQRAHDLLGIIQNVLNERMSSTSETA